MNRFLDIGARGWEHSGWVDSFYPEGLPEDWRLDFYATQFRFVLVPDAHWRAAGEAGVARWREETHAQFRFFLEWRPRLEADAAADATALRACAEALGERLLGVLLRPAEGGGNSLTPGPAGLAELAATWPVYAEADADVEATAGLRPCWRPDRTASGSCALGLVPAAPDATPPDRRRLGTLLRQFLAQAGAEIELHLVFEGEPPPAAALHDAQVIADLLLAPASINKPGE